MSYARFGWDRSDVYVFVGIDAIICCGCALKDSFGSFESQTTAGIVSHLREHISEGHTVPDDVIPNLEHDAKDNDSFIATGEWLNIKEEPT